MLEELEKVKQDCLNCQKCPLAKTRTNVVFSDGKPNSNIVLILVKIKHYCQVVSL